MVSVKWLLIGAAASAIAVPTLPPKNDCGKVDVFLTGLPPFHPLVIAQGWDPVMVDNALRTDARNIIAHGYNLRVSFLGPEADIGLLEKDLEGHKWRATGVGFGVRGANTENLTALFEDMIQIFREDARHSFIYFNRSPNTTIEALQRRVPLQGDCTNSPGKDLGFNVYCDIC